MRDRLPKDVVLEGPTSCLPANTYKDYLYETETHYMECLNSCKRCSDGRTCAECGAAGLEAQKFFLIQNTDPHQCTDSCSLDDRRHKIEGDKQGKGNCIQCLPNEYLLAKTDGSRECIRCDQDGQSPDQETQLCHICETGCQRCGKESACLSCGDHKHFIDLDGKTCVAECHDKNTQRIDTTPRRCQSCPNRCLACSQSVGCIICEEGFYRDDQGRCQKCKPGCKCNSPDRCTSCLDPTQYLQSDLNSCSDTCEKGEYQDKNKIECRKCQFPCVECSSTNQCSKCSTKYQLIHGTCKACPSKCEVCDNDTKCTKCLLGFFLNKGECVECPAECLECDSSSCLNCKPNFA